MKFLTLRTLSALSLAALLAACGGPQDALPTQTAASIQTGSATTSVRVSADASTGSAGAATTNTTGATGSAATGGTGVPTASATMPQPDCAADGCNAPRIIDANAEAWRYAAMQRAAADVSQS
jgi:hypothetical protein